MTLRFSISIVAGAPVDTMAAARAADSQGFDLVYVGDIQSTHRELYTSLTLVATNSERIHLGPGVTNPVTRHPAVTAGALATLDEISGGRGFLGLGSGDSAVHNIGERAATLAQTEAYLATVRGIWADGTAEHRGVTVHGRSWERQLPVLMSAHGPKALRLAGRVADGVIAGVGMTPEAVEFAREHVARGAADAGRDSSDIDVWFMAYPALGPREDVTAKVGSVLAAGGNLLARSPAAVTVPDRHRGAFTELAASYDYSAHVHADAGGPNATLIQRLGLVDYLSERFGLLGEPEEVRQAVAERSARGVSDYWLIYSRADLVDLIHRWGSEVVLPARSAGV